MAQETDLKSVGEKLAGSNPVSATIYILANQKIPSVRFLKKHLKGEHICVLESRRLVFGQTPLHMKN